MAVIPQLDLLLLKLNKRKSMFYVKIYFKVLLQSSTPNTDNFEEFVIVLHKWYSNKDQTGINSNFSLTSAPSSLAHKSKYFLIVQGVHKIKHVTNIKINNLHIFL